VNIVPCIGFVKKSASMLWVTQYATFPLFFYLVCDKKYHMSTCLVLHSWIVGLHFVVLVGMYINWDNRKCLVHSSCAIESLIVTISASVELYVRFCCPFSEHHEYSAMTLHVWVYSPAQVVSWLNG